jgi:hypothetical protein
MPILKLIVRAHGASSTCEFNTIGVQLCDEAPFSAESHFNDLADALQVHFKTTESAPDPGTILIDVYGHDGTAPSYVTVGSIVEAYQVRVYNAIVEEIVQLVHDGKQYWGCNTDVPVTVADATEIEGDFEKLVGVLMEEFWYYAHIWNQEESDDAITLNGRTAVKF